ncbi:uncharacterized protein CTRU02_204754 [Colletotrichum truncatum]|uniref:Uncharacterized protein n=1 Tax=Colletotrichum truncatum TaxID=5467 RepID=A0ACC3ZD05_COLTU|nr:uncharacterized protein CTRU02_02988 [Colletotrichum truncatum]KAF6797946.1 hypothetical protein CTRU02_02988 [Colletotrichum truncatum]
MTETVLIFGASGNIGVSAVIGALRAKRNVIALVRNQESGRKIVDYVGTSDGITIVEADITSEDAIQGVVDQVRAGKLPSFQHVFASPGGLYWETPTVELETAALREIMRVNVETYLYAYRATVPYLLEKGVANSTWTMCTGASGDIGLRAAPAITQGALFSFANVAARENEGTNVRFNEIYLAYRVQYHVDLTDESQYLGLMHLQNSRDFAPLYEQLLDRTDIRSKRVNALSPQDVIKLSYETRFKDF